MTINRALSHFFTHIIQCDRRGNKDLITSISFTELCSEEFIKATDHLLFGYKTEDGLMTDVLELKERGVEVSCINMSCGYYKPHTDEEFTDKNDLLNCQRFVEHIIENCTEVYPHKYEGYSYPVRNIAKIDNVGISTVMRLKKEFCN